MTRGQGDGGLAALRAGLPYRARLTFPLARGSASRKNQKKRLFGKASLTARKAAKPHFPVSPRFRVSASPRPEVTSAAPKEIYRNASQHEQIANA